MKLLEITRGLRFTLLSGERDTDFTDLVYDSRKVVPGCLFVCMKGARFDPHGIIDEIIQQGARGVVVEQPVVPDPGVTMVQVEDAREALALLSAAYFGYPAEKMKIIGVTGTKGKTTTTHMIQRILNYEGAKTGMIGTNGIRIGKMHRPTLNTTPESFDLQKIFRECAEAGCSHVVMEVSSQAVKMRRIAGIVFDVGVFTNLSPDHIGPGEHENFEEYRMCKTRFLDACEIALINMDDPQGEFVFSQGKARVKYTMGEDAKWDFSFSGIHYVREKDFLGLEFSLHQKKGSQGQEDFQVRAGIPGKFNVYNALAAIGVCALLGISKKSLQEGLRKIHVEGRMETVFVSRRFQVIVDYAHNALATESLIETLRAYHPKRLVVVFGCGGNRSKDRRYSMGEICGKLADFSIVTADNSRFEKTQDIIADIVSRLAPTGGDYITIPDRREAIFYAVQQAREGDLIAVIGKGHEDYQEINGVRHHFLDREVILEALKESKEDV